MRRLDQEGEHELEDLEEGEGGELVRSGQHHNHDEDDEDDGGGGGNGGETLLLIVMKKRKSQLSMKSPSWPTRV